MRILTIVKNLGLGGTQRSAQTHAEAYQEAGMDSAVLAYEGGGGRQRELEEQGIAVFSADEQGSDGSLRAARNWKPDAVHVHRVGYADPVTDEILSALRKAGVRAVIETNHFARADRSSGRNIVDVHIQLSKWCLWQWRRRCHGLTPRPLGIAMPHIIRSDRFGVISGESRARWRDEHAIPRDAIVFGRIGQPNYPSWSKVLIDAFGRIASEDENAWLVTVGMPEQMRAKRDALPEPVRRRVVSIDFLHGDEALRNCYGSLDIFSHASQCGETFGMVICEAALAGVPTVTLSTPARANSQIEVVGHDRGGLVAGNTNAFTGAMRRLLNEPETRRRLGRGASEWVKEHCDSRRITADLLGVFDDIVQSQNRDELAQRLRNKTEMTTDVSTNELIETLTSVPGSNPRRDKLLMKLSTLQWAGKIKKTLAKMFSKNS